MQSIRGVAPPSEYDRRRRPQRGCRSVPCGASHEVFGSFSTAQLSSPLIRGLPSPVRSVPRVSHPLDGLLLDSLPGLVSCQSAHGVPDPTELFPRPEHRRLSALHAFLPFIPDTGRRPARPSGLQTRRGAADRRGTCRTWLQGFTPRVESVATPSIR